MSKSRVVNSFLIDDESKFIFEKRVQYNKTHDYKYIEELVRNSLHEKNGNVCYYLGKEKELIELAKGRNRLVIFGLGIKGKQLINILLEEGVSIYKIIDNHVEGTYKGIEVVRPDSLCYEGIDGIIITPMYLEVISLMKQQLMELGVKGGVTLLLRDYIPWTDAHNQYFAKDIIKLNENEVFIDAGVYNLGTSIEFEKKCEEYGVKRYRILAFEPDKEAFLRCKNIKETKGVNVELHEKGLWSCNTTIMFEENTGGASHITSDETGCSIEAIALDDFWCTQKEAEPVTFIKMDIEGAELNALQGCRNIILTHKPKLAISVYHKNEDIIEIPLYVKELVPEYKIYFRHYSNHVTETIMYAVIE